MEPKPDVAKDADEQKSQEQRIRVTLNSPNVKALEKGLYFNFSKLNSKLTLKFTN